jgi:hypothetical protein
MYGCLSSPFFTHAITPPLAARRSDTEPKYGGEIKNRASVSPLPFPPLSRFSLSLDSSMHFRARLAVSPSTEASSKRQGDGQRFQKKAMKTTNPTIEASAPANVRPSSVSKHQLNRGLSTASVLNCLRTRLPRQYEVAEVVGKWVWLDVSPARKPGLASLLWALGFHWNQRRGVWQHPCGTFNPFGIHPADPRIKYRSYFPADVLPA